MAMVKAMTITVDNSLPSLKLDCDVGYDVAMKGASVVVNVSHSFWVEAINTACYYSNRLYCHPMMEKTPYELLNGRKPNIAYF